MTSGARAARGLIACTTAALVLAAATTSPALAAEEGPALTVAPATLAASLTCGPGVRGAKQDPVLLTPAFSTADASYGWNYLPQLEADGIPACAISVPDEGYGDLQRTAEHVVYAVRRMAADSGRKVVLLGHQHGALDELWAMTYWPDVARSVSDLVSLETPYEGTTSSTSLCGEGGAGGRCTAALRQITKGSDFLEALRAAPLPEGPAITSISSTDDTLITPQPEASHLSGARNIVLQDICRGRSVDHFAALADAVGYLLFLDARTHRGPADPARIPGNACAQQYMARSNPVALGLTSVFFATFLARNELSSDPVEPAVRTYATRRVPRLSLGVTRARLSPTGRVALLVSCASVGQTACTGIVSLADGADRPSGREAFEVAPGETATVHVRVAARVREALRTKRRVPLSQAARAVDALANRGHAVESLVVTAPRR